MALPPKTLAWKNRFVKNLNQVLSDRFDDYPLLPPLPYVDLTSRVPLVFRLNQTEYTQMYSALAIGAEIIYPDISHELMYIFEVPDDYEPEEDFCLDYQTDDSDIITFAPQDPHTEPDVTPPGYLMPPFWVVGDVLPEFLPDWFAEIITDIIEQFTGYEDDDVLTTIGSIPLFANWFELLEDGLPRFTITVPTSGSVELHLLSVPLGGRLLVSVDVEFDLADIIEGIITEGFKLIELERDYSSAPPELDVDHIEEIVLEANEPHVIYCTFLPVVDLDAIPLKFGGGIRKVVWCPDEEPDEECPECPECPEELTIPEIISDDTYFETEYVPAVFGEYYSETVAAAAAAAAIYDDTPQSVAPDVPTGTPDALEKNALCYAVNRFVELYASQKLCLIQSQNFIETLWSNFANAANDFYNTVSNLMLPLYSANIFSCFVDDAAAMTALQDTAAIEELACYLYEELKTVTMSQANFDAAILDAATTLTDEAQEIACLMQNDSSEDIFISFLMGYNIALERQAANDDLECPCETDTYWMWLFDFSLGAQGWFSSISSGQLVSVLTGGEWVNNASAGFASCWIQRNFDQAYVIKAAGLDYDVLGHAGSGSDSISMFGKQFISLAGTTYQTDTVSGLTSNGNNLIRNGYDAGETNDSESYGVQLSNAGAPTGSNLSKINRVVLYGLPTGGQKPPGSVWVASVPTSPTSLFP